MSTEESPHGYMFANAFTSFSLILSSLIIRIVLHHTAIPIMHADMIVNSQKPGVLRRVWPVEQRFGEEFNIKSVTLQDVVTALIH